MDSDTFLKKPSLMRLTKCAGIKIMSEECLNLLRSVIHERTYRILESGISIKKARNNKTLTDNDIFTASSLLGTNITHSNDLDTSKI